MVPTLLETVHLLSVSASYLVAFEKNFNPTSLPAVFLPSPISFSTMAGPIRQRYVNAHVFLLLSDATDGRTCRYMRTR